MWPSLSGGSSQTTSGGTWTASPSSTWSIAPAATSRRLRRPVKPISKAVRGRKTGNSGGPRSDHGQRWQTVSVEPAAGVTAAGHGGRAGQRGRYGIDGGYAG